MRKLSSYFDLTVFVNSMIAIGLALMLGALLIVLTDAPPVLVIAGVLVAGAVCGLVVTEFRSNQRR